MTDASIIQRFASLSVNLNGLIIPAGGVDRAVSRYAAPLFIKTDLPEFPVRLVGSSAVMTYRGRPMVISTQHQLRGSQPQDVCVLVPGGKSLLTTAGFQSYAIRPDTDAFDMAAFDFSGPYEAAPEIRAGFPPLVRHYPGSFDSVLAAIVVGYPSGGQLYEPKDVLEIRLTGHVVHCKPPTVWPSDAAIFQLEPFLPLTFDPDGLSGAPMFLLTEKAGNFSLLFGGLILTGGRTVLRALKLAMVFDFLDQCVANQ